MILPSKHTRYQESYIVISGVILTFLDTQLTLDEILDKYNNYLSDKGEKSIVSFESIVYAIDLLFILNKVSSKENLIFKL